MKTKLCFCLYIRFSRKNMFSPFSPIFRHLIESLVFYCLLRTSGPKLNLAFNETAKKMFLRLSNFQYRSKIPFFITIDFFKPFQHTNVAPHFGRGTGTYRCSRTLIYTDWISLSFRVVTLLLGNHLKKEYIKEQILQKSNK